MFETRKRMCRWYGMHLPHLMTSDASERQKFSTETDTAEDQEENSEAPLPRYKVPPCFLWIERVMLQTVTSKNLLALTQLMEGPRVYQHQTQRGVWGEYAGQMWTATKLNMFFLNDLLLILQFVTLWVTLYSCWGIYKLSIISFTVFNSTQVTGYHSEVTLWDMCS